MNTVTALKLTREKLARPYVFHKGDMHSLRRIKGELIDCYCAVGALRSVVYGSPGSSHGGVVNNDLYNASIKALNAAINPGEKYSSAEWRVTNFNDSHKKSEVLDIFDKAIAGVETA